MSRAPPPRIVRSRPQRRQRLGDAQFVRPHGSAAIYTSAGLPPTLTAPTGGGGMFLYLEVTGGQGVGLNHSRSGQTCQFQLFTGVGLSGMYAHASGAATLPMLTSFDDNIIGTGAALHGLGILPKLTSTGEVGIYGVPQPLPALTGIATGTIPNLLRGAETLPMVTGTGTALIGSLARGAAVLPKLSSAGRTGWGFATQMLPALRGTGIGHLELHIIGGGAASQVLPHLRGSGTMGQTYGVLHGAGQLLPMLQGMSGSANAGASNRLPALRGAASASSGTRAVQQAWVMNLSNIAVTQFTNFGYRAFARAFDRYWAVGIDGGLYLMQGDLDDTEPIDWEWETGLTDIGSRGIKGILGVYIDGVCEPGCTLTLVTERNRYIYTHRPFGTRNNHQTQRVSTGRGVRSVNLGLGMASESGAYVEIDSLTPEYVVTDRNL